MDDPSRSCFVAQVEGNRRKEQEILKGKKDLELLTKQYESQEASLKKRHQEVVTDLNEQVERTNKLKIK